MFPIIGDPVIYVESPVRLTRTLAARGYDGVCVPMRVPEAALDVVLAGLSATSNVGGILITMPHKFSVFSHCATRSERSDLLKVVSVMRRNDDGSWHGDVLDGLAFVKAQRARGAEIEGRRALLVGVGGAGSAIAMALLDAGVGELVIAGHGTTPFIGAAARVGCSTATGADMVDAVQDLMADFLIGAPSTP